VEDPDIWTAHRLTSLDWGNGGKARIPALKYKISKVETSASTNIDKGHTLAKGFFLARPPADDKMAEFIYPPQCEDAGEITLDQILAQVQRLKPFKAPGLDGIPNIVLTKNADLIVDRLLPIYKAMVERSSMYKPWKEFITIVLRKPGKPRYDMLKAYRPITLLNTMWKVITAIVANHITYVMEKHQLLSANHFGGHPGQTTVEAMHLLTNRIKAAWRLGKVTSVLFLDIEGTFPNANLERLVHNLRKQQVPLHYVNFIHNMLKERVTTLRFNGYTIERIPIDNGIGQGNPLSMVMYQYYNVDLIDIPKHPDKDAVAYVDNAFMLALGKDFPSAHQRIAAMMSREGGVENWSKMHSSPLKYSKLALINFAHSSKSKENPTLQLPWRTVHPVNSVKYLGVFFDRNLNWKTHQAYTVEKGIKWAAQI
jgi:hypothetical protein